MIKIPKEIPYESLDHGPEKFPAFSPDYNEDDIGVGLNLTVTLFGYQLDGEALEILMNEMMVHLVVSMANEQLNKKIEK